LVGCGASRSSSTPGSTGAPAQPSFGQTVRLEPVSGKVLITLPGATTTALTARRVVPVGTVVDTTAGNVALTSATPPPTRLQSGQFHGGIFQINQSPDGQGLTNLVIRDNQPRSSACGATPSAVGARQIGLLRGNAHGRFQTTGQFAAATVAGTEWGVRDRCDGTLVVVEQGVVNVQDLRQHKTVVVRAGQTYLARA
jgi:hypothetical protein